MLRQQMWMADDDEFDHIIENSQRALKLNSQHENRPYVKKFLRGVVSCLYTEHTF